MSTGRTIAVAQTVKNPPAGDLGLISGLARSPGEGNGYPGQYSGLENSMDRGAWWSTVYGMAKSQTWLSDFHFHFHLTIWTLSAKECLLFNMLSRFVIAFLSMSKCLLISWQQSPLQ